MAREILAHNPPALARPVGFSHGYEARGGRVLFLAGQVATDAQGRVVGAGDVVAQFRQVCENLRALLASAGGQMTDVVKLTIHVLDVDDYKKHLREIGGVYREHFGKHFPAMTLLGVRDLFDREAGCLIEIDGVAVLP
ncbi:MAG: RidA family protein [Candidatus Rokubacteria bacterium]|nr:RidA family protein [Candidatus Rokubacteria bacterium]MBI3824442.1 RidA family protein [Candidatus Rokubacteria bacterium]